MLKKICLEDLFVPSKGLFLQEEKKLEYFLSLVNRLDKSSGD